MLRHTKTWFYQLGFYVNLPPKEAVMFRVPAVSQGETGRLWPGWGLCVARAHNYRNISSYKTTDGKQTSHNLQFPDFFF